MSRQTTVKTIQRLFILCEHFPIVLKLNQAEEYLIAKVNLCAVFDFKTKEIECFCN